MKKKNMKEWSGGPSISNQNELIKVIEKLYKKSSPFRKKIDAWLKDVGAGAGAALREDEAAAEREMGWDNQTQETDYAKRQHESVDMNEKRKWMEKAKEESEKEGSTVHLNFDGKNYELSDWYDSDETIASFDDGRRFNESVNESGKISLKKLVVNENRGLIKHAVQRALKDSGYNLKQSDFKFGLKKAATGGYEVFLNGSTLGYDDNLKDMVKKFTDRIQSDPGKYSLNEPVNESGKISLKKLVVNENSSGADFGIYDDLEDLLDIVKRSIKLADKTQFSDKEAKIILDLATSIYNQTNE